MLRFTKENMRKITIEQLGAELKRERRGRGLREVAADIGISTATLSRIESGRQPDLETFSKVCKWLRVDAGAILGCSAEPSVEVDEASASSGEATPVFAHFRVDREIDPETARHLGELILATQKLMKSQGAGQLRQWEIESLD